MEWTTVIITNVVQPSKTAFGVREDNGESVFIPPAVSKTMGLEISDVVLAKLVPNRDLSENAGKRTKSWKSLGVEGGKSVPVGGARLAVLV